MKRASYREGVKWIAWNDDGTERDPAVVAESISALLLADLFDVAPERVGRDVVRFREREDAEHERRAVTAARWVKVTEKCAACLGAGGACDVCDGRGTVTTRRRAALAKERNAQEARRA